MYARMCGLNGGIIELESAFAISLYRAAALRAKPGYFRGDISLSLGVGRPVPYLAPQPSSLETEEQNEETRCARPNVVRIPRNKSARANVHARRRPSERRLRRLARTPMGFP